jgi:hypothetical protein
MSSFFKPGRAAASALSGALAFLLAAETAVAQPPPPPAQGYNANQPPPQGYDPNQPPPPPQGYPDPAMQPPPGYTPQDAARDSAEAAREQDREYAAAAEGWAQANCVRQEANRTTAGAILGGVLGAVIGSNLAGGRARGAGAIVGGALGATAGGAIANNAGPGCPAGYVLRPGAPPFYGPPVVAYAEPAWYNPWIWYDGRWIYRPYPYHRYWRDHYYPR